MKRLSAAERRKARARANDTWAQTRAGLGNLTDAITPWLLDLGTWIYGGLIAFSLIIISALLTVGPVDVAVKVAAAAFALALPLDIAGFVILRLFTDMAKVNLAEIGARSFVEAGLRVDSTNSFTVTEGRLRSVAVRYSYTVLALTALTTLVGVSAALWHMAWWIAVVFVVMVFVSQGVVMAAISALGPQGRRRTAGGESEAPKPDTSQAG